MLKTVASLYYALRNARVEPVGSARIENGRLVIEAPGLSSSAPWPGFFFFRGVRFYDDDIAEDEYGAQITGERKRSVKITVSSSGTYTASYYDGAPPSGWPANVWYIDTWYPSAQYIG
jgi:hypothetical protein